MIKHTWLAIMYNSRL
jgi:hypothetical protein